MSRSHKDGRRGGSHESYWHGIGGDWWSWCNTQNQKKYAKRISVRQSRRKEMLIINEQIIDMMDNSKQIDGLHFWLTDEEYNFKRDQEYEQDMHFLFMSECEMHDDQDRDCDIPDRPFRYGYRELF